MTKLVRIFLTLALIGGVAVSASAGGKGEETSGAESDQELLIWHEVGFPIDPFVESYEADHPNVRVETEALRTEDIRSKIQVALRSGSGPDVFTYDTGPGYAGALVDAGMLLPLDQHYDNFGWDERFYDWTTERVTFGNSVYGIATSLENLGVYYNKAIFDELGLEIPETYEEFIDVSAELRENDYIPVAFANQQQWPAFHMFSIFANTLAGKEKIESLLFEGEGRWDDEEFVEAIRLPFVELNQNEVFIEGTNGVTYDDGNLLFFNGQAGMHVTGMWLLNDIMENVPNPENIGFFAFPDIHGNPSLPPAGVGTGLFISSETEVPDLAAAFLDQMFSPEMGPTWIEELNTVPPFDVDLDQLDLAPLERNMYSNIQAISGDMGGGMGYNIDVLTPARFNETMATGFQEVLAGEKTPREQAEDLQSAWEAARQEQQ